MPKKTIDQKIEDLALSVGKGFKELHEEMNSLRDEVRTGFGSLTERLDKIEFRFTGHEQRLSVLEDKVQQISRKVGLERR